MLNKTEEHLVVYKRIGKSCSIVQDSRTNRLGLVSDEGMILPCIYHTMWPTEEISDNLFLLEAIPPAPSNSLEYFLLRIAHNTQTIEKLENVDEICIGTQGCLAYSEKGKWTFVAKDGRGSSEKYDYINISEEHRGNRIKRYRFNFPVKVKIGNLYGFIDEQGNQLTSTLYPATTEFKDGIALVFTGSPPYEPENRKLIDTTGKFTDTLPSPFVFSSMGNVNSTTVEIRSFVIGGCHGFFDVASRKVVIPCIYDTKNDLLGRSSTFLYGPAHVSKGGKSGHIDKQGKVVIPFIYENGNNFSKEGLASVKKDGKWGCIDIKGKAVIPFIYENGAHFSEEGLASVKKDGKWGCIDIKGKVVIPFNFDEKIVFNEGFAIAKLMEKSGVIGAKGDVVIPFNYEYIKSFNWGLAVVKVSGNDDLGVVDKFGKLLVQPKYGSISINQHAINASNNYSRFGRRTTRTTIYNHSGKIMEEIR